MVNPRLVAGALIVLVIIGAAIIVTMRGWETQKTEPTKTQTETQTGIARQVVLLGSGATFIHPQLDKWSKEFSALYPNVRIEYNPTGSGTGQTQFMQKVVDFAASDPPLPTSRWAEAKERPEGVIQMPIILGAVVMVYNIPGLEGRLKLDGEVIALIYKGEIEYWDDPRIKALNPDLKLPREKVVAVHRSDSSGTTHVFTLFLHKAAPNVWTKDLVEKAIEWPVDKTGRGLGGKGNQGVVELVRRTPYSIGYVEYSYAYLTKLPWALVRNAEGFFVDATPESMMKAAENAYPLLPPSLEDDFNKAWEAILYAPGKDSYPITSFSFLLFYKVYSPDKVEAVKRFIEWVNTEGQKPKNIVEGYVAIPESLRQFNLRAIQLIKSSG
ncbi:MAG: phosphate ABC transporter substrate-binding protein PstS [Acidilobaceae archaeon]